MNCKKASKNAKNCSLIRALRAAQNLGQLSARVQQRIYLTHRKPWNIRLCVSSPIQKVGQISWRLLTHGTRQWLRTMPALLIQYWTVIPLPCRPGPSLRVVPRLFWAITRLSHLCWRRGTVQLSLCSQQKRQKRWTKVYRSCKICKRRAFSISRMCLQSPTPL